MVPKLADAALPTVFDYAEELFPYILIGLLIAAAIAVSIVLIVKFSKKKKDK